VLIGMLTMNLQYRPSDQSFAVQATMRLRRLAERIACRNRYADLAARNVTIQTGEGAWACDRIVRAHVEHAPFGRWRLDAVRMDHTSSWPHEIEAPFELVAAGQRRQTIQAIGRVLAEFVDGFLPPGINDAIGTEPMEKTRRGRSGRGGNHLSATLNGELNGDGADGARRAKDENGLS
jgi:hypothetical protein